MDPASAAVGLVSFGIEICQGLLSYYNDWKGYNSDIDSTYHSIDDLSRTLVLLKASLDSEELDDERRERVRTSLQSCEDGLVQFSQKARELRTYAQPTGLRQKARAELQRAKYPFQAKTLTDLQNLVGHIQERLKLAIQVLQLDAVTSSRRTLKQVAVDTNDTASRVAAIEAQTARIANAQQSQQFKQIAAWLSPPDSLADYEAARQRHEPQTGWQWKDYPMLDSYARHPGTLHKRYRVWLWHILFLVFRQSETIVSKSSSLLGGLIRVEGAWIVRHLQPIREIQRQPTSGDKLETMLISALESFDEVFVLLDALDECPEVEAARRNLLEGLEKLLRRAPNLKVMATSRELSDIRDSIEALNSLQLSVDRRCVNRDIQRWTSSQLGSDKKLRRLDLPTKVLIEETIAARADGTFRWAYCQLQELRRLKSTKPKYIANALHSLPMTLDATYERMLNSIEEMYREEALRLLKWLVYATHPPTLMELAEASILDPAGEGSVDIANRGALEDALEILGSLVVSFRYRTRDADIREYVDEVDIPILEEGTESDVSDTSGSIFGPTFPTNIRVRLAHYSVREYLESRRIRESNANMFYLEVSQGHGFLAQCCLVYLLHYLNRDDRSNMMTNSGQHSGDLPNERTSETFPLLQYAAENWHNHALLQASGGIDREVALLASDSMRHRWLSIHEPDTALENMESGGGGHRGGVGSGIYYASFAGLESVLRALLEAKLDVNAQGGYYGNALNAASRLGHATIVLILLENGADVNAKVNQSGVRYQRDPLSNPLFGAVDAGHLEIAKLLLEKGALTNMGGEIYECALLYAAAKSGFLEILKRLIYDYRKSNAPGLDYGSLIHAAVEGGDPKTTRFLLEINPNPGPNQKPPSAPLWVLSAIENLHRDFPTTRFEPAMLTYSLDSTTGVLRRIDNKLRNSAPEDERIFFIPRIVCKDCPGKLYQVKPATFRIDLRVHCVNRLHRANVEKRLEMERTADSWTVDVVCQCQKWVLYNSRNLT